MNPEELAQFTTEIKAKYEEFKAQNLSLDLTRGKPSSEQLDFSDDLLALPGKGNFTAADGTDCRNYGGLTGIKDIREIYADLMNCDVNNVYCGDASSLNIEFDLISFAYMFGTQDSPRPWKDEASVKWICPVPGYDRHHTITEHFGFEMVTVPMFEDGPDMDAVRELVKDPTVKGMWNVPTFGNPTGVSYSEDVCRPLAEMDTAAPDFRMLWDNAYAVHTLTDEFPSVHDVLAMSEAAGNPNRFWAFTSTSKITFAGSGVSFLISSKGNLDWYAKHANVRGIGPNKINQLAHAKFFGDAEGVRAIMRKHAGSLAPKFNRVLDILDERLGGRDVATWTKPEGGYFISFDTLEGCAKKVVSRCAKAGVIMTSAGATWPGGKDPHDSNIRIAPSFPPLNDLRIAAELFTLCVKYVSVEKLLANMDAAEGKSAEKAEA